MGWCCWQEWNREGKLQVRDDNLPLSMYQEIVIFSQLFTVVANKDDVWCIHFLYVLCLFCSLFFFQQNCRAFRTISFIPLKLLSPYILFCFTFSRAEESAPDILNYIPKQRAREALRHAILRSQINKGNVRLTVAIAIATAIAHQTANNKMQSQHASSQKL